MLDQKIQYLALCGVILMLWLLLNRRLARSAAAERAHWEPTTGRVEQVRQTDRGACPVVNYYIRGESVRGVPCHLRYADIPYRKGQAVSILYDPEHPDSILLRRQAEHDGELGPLYYAGLVGLCCVLLAKYYFTFIA